MSSERWFVPTSRRGKAFLAVCFVIGAASVGGLLTATGGTAWTGVLSAAALAALILLGARAEVVSRRVQTVRPAPRTQQGIQPAPGPLRRIERRVNELDHGLERQNMQLHHLAELVQATNAHASTHHDVSSSFAQMQAFVQLNGRFDDPPIVPPMRGWAASPDVVLHLVSVLIRERPAVVLECGSGVSTTWLAAAARQFSPDTRVIALDHDASFAEQTRRNLAENELDEWAEVRDAPLEPFGSPEGPLWYARSAVRDLTDVGLVFVDGPPATTGSFARRPALDALSSALCEDAVLIIDDTIRREEQAMVAEWLTARPTMTERALRCEKGAIELRLRPPSLD